MIDILPDMTMWEQYRKTAIATQLFILAVCISSYFLLARDWRVIAMLFVVMQLGSLGGAWLGSRIVRQAEREENRLPLDKRR